MASAMAILEDERGCLLKLVVYNALPPGPPSGAQLAAADALLPEGAAVCVTNPFYKCFADGTLGVRVDDPQDLVLLGVSASAAGGDHGALKELGNAAFRAGLHAEALERYSEALRALDASGPDGARTLSPTLANLAASLLSAPLGAARDALLVASSAAAVDAGYAKARFRAAAACKALGDARHARLCVAETRRLGAAGPSCDALLADLPPPGDGHTADDASFALVVSAAADGESHEALRGLAASGADATAEGDGCAACKARGNVHFAAGRHAAAAAEYVAALLPLRQAAATLLCNRAAVQLELRRPAAALADALAALTLQPAMSKAHWRRVLAMQALRAPAAALEAAVARGLRDCPDDAALLQLQRSGSDAIVAREQPPRARDATRSRGAGNPGTMSERDLVRMEQAKDVGVDDIAKMNAMMAALPAATQRKMREQGLVLDDRVKPFHAEFERARAWPAGCDAAACRLKLLGAYENCRGMPRGDALMLLRPGKESTDPHELLSRLGSTDPAAIRWLLTSEVGSVREPTKFAYDSRVFHSFSNADSTALVMTPGTAHVAIGFVDLGTLRDAGFDAGNARPGPLCWVGVEASAYAVAKSAVVDAMLRAAAPVDAILEVWFSAAWCATTLAAFRAAVDDLQGGGADTARGRQRHPDVAALLAAWRTATVPLAQARVTWLEENTRTWLEIGNFTLAEDRHALCAYALTGQLLDGATVGSVCMFAPLPLGFSAKRSLNESVFHCVPVDKLWERRREGAPDVVAATAEHLRRGVQRIRDRVAAGEVTIELWLEHLSLENPAAMARISALEPFTVSWSNICDYDSFANFHAMARACSAPGCSAPALRDLNSGATDMMGKMFDLMGAKPYLLWPPVSHIRNHVDWMLQVMTAPIDFCTRWADAFFAAAQLEDPSQQVARLGRSLKFGHLTRCHGVLHFTYTYDPAVRMKVIKSE